MHVNTCKAYGTTEGGQ